MKDGLYIRVKQALTWLKRNQGILQKDIADKMGMAEASFTRALSRVKEKNDEDFVISFHSAVREYISLEYLLEGKGELVCDNTKDASPNSFSEPTSRLPDMSSVFNSALAKADETISALKSVIKAKDEQIADFRRELEDKRDHIETLKHRIAELRRIIDSNQYDLEHLPFPPGVADKPNDRKTHVNK